MKSVAAPTVKREQLSDVDLGPASRHTKGKSSARLESPIDIASDDSGSYRILDTPKAKAPVRKAPARLRSPVTVSSDESGHEQLSKTPKAEVHPPASGSVPEALENQRCLFGLYLCLCCC
jgi:hypothetical protein